MPAPPSLTPLPSAPAPPPPPPSTHTGLESALGRLRELEREQQQLEVTVNDLQEENLELSTEVCAWVSVGAGGGRIRDKG